MSPPAPQDPAAGASVPAPPATEIAADGPEVIDADTVPEDTMGATIDAVSYTHLRAHETSAHL
eukprot:12953270-Alexandrium_andersonii.AAC.1